jgi:hypothetical protein
MGDAIAALDPDMASLAAAADDGDIAPPAQSPKQFVCRHPNRSTDPYATGDPSFRGSAPCTVVGLSNSLMEGMGVPADSKTRIEKIETLPAERIAEIEDFVDFIRLREQERTLTRTAAAASAPAFAAVWSNPEDDIYDAL